MTYCRKFIGYIWAMVIVSISIIIPLIQCPACASPIAPNVSLKTSETQNFQAALNALAAQGHVAIVAEGVPLHPSLSADDAVKLTEPLPLDDEVKAVASAYDYDAKQDGDMFCLTKRYTDPADVPVLTFDFYRHVLQQLQLLSAPYDPQVPRDRIIILGPLSSPPRRDQYRVISPLADPLISSFSNQQLSLMHQNSLAISSLTPNQQALVRRLALSLDVQRPMQSADFALSVMAQDTTLGWADFGPFHHLFGFTITTQATGHRSFAPFSVPTDGRDSTNPAAAGASEREGVPPAQTIGEVLSAASEQGFSSPKVVVEEAITDVPITVAGEDYAPLRPLLDAIASIYGLHVSASSQGNASQLSLGFAELAPPNDVAKLPAALLQVLPPPLCRSLRLDDIAAAQAALEALQENLDADTPSIPTPQETPAELNAAMQKRKFLLDGMSIFRSTTNTINHFQARAFLLRTATVLKLRSLVEPQLSASSDVALSSLDSVEKNAFATVLLLDAIPNIKDLITQPLPDEVVHMSQYNLGGGVTGTSSHPMFVISFVKTDTNGKIIVQGMTLSGLDYNKQAQ